MNSLRVFKAISAFRPQNTLRMFSTDYKKINFKFEDLEGRSWFAEGNTGESVMEAGIMGGVPFEVACGGNCECCTCHVYLSLELRQAPDYTEPKENELDAIDFAEASTDESRLACQLKICESMEGQVIKFVNAE